MPTDDDSISFIASLEHYICFTSMDTCIYITMFIKPTNQIDVQHCMFHKTSEFLKNLTKSSLDLILRSFYSKCYIYYRGQLYIDTALLYQVII